MNESASYSDEECLQLLQSGNEQALAFLMNKFYADVFNYAIRLHRDRELVKDCIQEVF